MCLFQIVQTGSRVHLSYYSITVDVISLRQKTRVMMFTTHFQLAPILGICKAIPLLPLFTTNLWSGIFLLLHVTYADVEFVSCARFCGPSKLRCFCLGERSLTFTYYILRLKITERVKECSFLVTAFHILHIIKKKTKYIGHMLRKDCLLKRAIVVKTEGATRRVRIGKLLQDDHKENVSCRNLEEKELYLTV
jgi:hypothetical protein